ncbi:hypothetical protein [Anaerocellum danielii]|uniref:Uncharacterized protein n=1 Tax=Anaerocellum danielii TaxID=1387557 RepID=A0ABZ0U4P1_9FIRM|nr:hypothetical protein [Caldicellulosiruptor danielii]WPX10052.1 hypothetical protein SOJ16_001311 [Caldicellulosiruptor danielii]
MKKFFIFSAIILVLFLTIFIITAFSFKLLSSQDSGVKEFEKTFNLRFPKGTVSEKMYDDYGGFHNDGMKLYKFHFTSDGKKSFASYIAKQKNWRKLPLSPAYQILMYGIKVQDSSGNTLERIGFAKKVDLPKISKGFWKAVGDRSVLTAKLIDYENLDIRTLDNLYSYDFSLAIYDAEKGILYMFKINT